MPHAHSHGRPPCCRHKAGGGAAEWGAGGARALRHRVHRVSGACRGGGREGGASPLAAGAWSAWPPAERPAANGLAPVLHACRYPRGALLVEMSLEELARTVVEAGYCSDPPAYKEGYANEMVKARGRGRGWLAGWAAASCVQWCVVPLVPHAVGFPRSALLACLLPACRTAWRARRTATGLTWPPRPRTASRLPSNSCLSIARCEWAMGAWRSPEDGGHRSVGGGCWQPLRRGG